MIRYFVRLPFRMAAAALTVPVRDVLRATALDSASAYVEHMADTFPKGRAA